ncbi:flavodoxin family protein [Paenibacillus stellifer]|uniref:flavodoxin family protein n=1 Tax=Paenibacillus stellifer TaxID=169760 RepID=UPI000A4CA828|nr:hypothetical protein [Paenibacillus stellifer]
MQESRTAIFYFSGTGNTEVVARLLSEALTREGGRADLFRIEDIIKGHRTPDYAGYGLTGYGLIGIGHPVMGFGASSLVERFVRQLPPPQGLRSLSLRRHLPLTTSITEPPMSC